MEPNAVNNFLDLFLAITDAGFGLIAGDVGYVLNALIVISITLAGAQWALAQEAPMAGFFRKVLFIGFFAFLINNWNALATAIAQSGALLGLRAGGSSMTIADLHDPGRVAGIGVDLFGRTLEVGEGMNILTDFFAMVTILIAALFVMFGFFVLALQIFVTLIGFKIGALAAFVALPWGVFNGTSWVAERPLGWVVSCAIRLFVLGLIASVTISFVDTLPGAWTLDAGGVLQVLLFGVVVLALSWFGPQLASEVVSGQPSLAAPDVVITGGAATATGLYSANQTRKAVLWTARAGAKGARAGGRALGAAINYARMTPTVKKKP